MMLPEVIENAFCRPDENGMTDMDRLLERMRTKDSERFGEILAPVWNDKYFKITADKIWHLDDGRDIYGYAHIERYTAHGFWTPIAEFSIDDYVAIENEDQETINKAAREGLRRMRLDTLPPLDAEDEVWYTKDDDEEPHHDPECENPYTLRCGYERFWRDYEGERYIDICYPRGQFKTY